MSDTGGELNRQNFARGPVTPAAGRQQPTDPNTLTIEVAGQRVQTWQEVRLTRGIEIMPSHFDVRGTERFPGDAKLVPLDPGQACQVRIGDDLVLTGYLDTYATSVTTQSHPVGVQGRSQTEDLVDCQAGMKPGQERSAVLTIKANTFLDLATVLCEPFGITVTEPDGEGTPLVSFGDGIPQFSMALGQTVYDVLEPIARWKRMLMLDGVDGNLILAKVGTKKHPSGFAMPGNVSKATVQFRKGERYSVYIPAQFSFDGFFDVAKAAGNPSANYYQVVPDEAAFAGQTRRDGKSRYRPLAVVSEQSFGGENLAEYRAKWEKARRYGRSQILTLEVSTWRDAAGALWEPNRLATVDLPALKIEKLTWLIAEVTFLRGFGGGTRAIITMMPPEAFAIEPSFFSPFDPQISQAISQGKLHQSIIDGSGGAGPSGLGQG